MLGDSLFEQSDANQMKRKNIGGVQLKTFCRLVGPSKLYIYLYDASFSGNYNVVDPHRGVLR